MRRGGTEMTRDGHGLILMLGDGFLGVDSAHCAHPQLLLCVGGAISCSKEAGVVISSESKSQWGKVKATPSS